MELNIPAQLSKADQANMKFAMRLSFGIGIFMLFLKTYAYSITGSAAILSDAAESVIHIFAIGFAVYSMQLSLKPADEDHLYGHEKISFFSAGFEGAVIICAAFYILYESVSKIIFGFELEHIGIGLLFTAIAVVINLVLSFYLIQRGRKYHSIILEANGKHILTDCWTSVAVIIALLLVQFTQISLFDPIIAIFAALNILRTGGNLIKKSIGGLMDQIDPLLNKKIVEILKKETEKKDLSFHHLRHRLSGHKVLIEFHLLFPKNIKLAEAHTAACQIESHVKNSLDMQADIFTHLEPQEGHDEIHKRYGLVI